MDWLSDLFRTLPIVPNAPYGAELATRIAGLLDMGGQIADCHAYYCGTGFVRDGGLYCWAHISEGYPDTHVRAFERRDDFIAWLANESDDSLSQFEGDGRLQIPGHARMIAETQGLAASEGKSGPSSR